MRRIFLCLAVCVANVAQAASILGFDVVDLGSSQIAMPNTYGDRLAGTPNIDMSYVNVLYTPQNFGGVVGVAAQTNLGTAQIIFTPDPGYGIHLISFDTGYYQALTVTTLNLLDGGSNVLTNLDPNTPYYTGVSHHYTPDFYQPGVLQLNFNAYEYLGIDNITFDQYLITSAVPEPSTLGIIGLGLTGFAWLRHCRPGAEKARRGQAPNRA